MSEQATPTSSAPPVESVREADQVRDSLIAAQARIAELEGQPGKVRPELQAELEESRAEILRLRDLLIGMEAELGMAKGRVTELEAQTSGLFGLKRKLLAQIAGPRALLGAARRRFGGG